MLGKPRREGFQGWRGKEFQVHQLIAERERLSEKCQFLRIGMCEVAIDYLYVLLSFLFLRKGKPILCNKFNLPC